MATGIHYKTTVICYQPYAMQPGL